jgi:hypothetical protein
MKRNISAGLAGAALAAVVGLTAGRFLGQPAKAAPPVRTPAVVAPAPAPVEPAATTMTPNVANVVAARARTAALLSGKVFPLTLKAEQIDSKFHLMRIVDTQGHFGLYASVGDTIVFGNKTFLVIYDVPLTSALAHPPQPKAGTTGKLMLVNMDDVQVIADMTPIGESGDDDEPDTAPEATPEVAPEKAPK